MEDPKRGMETDERVNRSPKYSTGKHNRLTIMILRDVGKVRSFKLSGRIVFWFFIFLLVYLPVSVLVINKHIELRRAFKEQARNIQQLEKDLSESRDDLQRSEYRAAIWEDFVNSLQESQETDADETPVQEEKSPQKAPQAAEETPPQDDTDSPRIVDTQDMVVQKQGSFIIVDFKLVNLLPDEKALGGYIHIIAESRSQDPPQVWTYPKEALTEDGMPKNYKRGELFIIKRFKPIHGRIDLVSSDVPPSIIRVLVYDQAGTLILKKEFAVGNES